MGNRLFLQVPLLLNSQLLFVVGVDQSIHKLIFLLHCTKNEVFHQGFLKQTNVFLVDFVTFTGEILDGKLHFFCSARFVNVPVFH